MHRFHFSSLSLTLLMLGILAQCVQAQGLCGDPIDNIHRFGRPVDRQITELFYKGKLLGLSVAEADKAMAACSPDPELKFGVSDKCGKQQIYGTAWISNANFWQTWPLADVKLDAAKRICAYSIYLQSADCVGMWYEVKAVRGPWISTEWGAREFALFGQLRIGEKRSDRWRHFFSIPADWAQLLDMVDEASHPPTILVQQ